MDGNGRRHNRCHDYYHGHRGMRDLPGRMPGHRLVGAKRYLRFLLRTHTKRKAKRGRFSRIARICPPVMLSNSKRRVPGAPGPDSGTWKVMPLHSPSYPQNDNSGLSNSPRPLPVICWDWTKAIALPRVPLAQRLIPFRGGDSGTTIALLRSIYRREAFSSRKSRLANRRIGPTYCGAAIRWGLGAMP